jgi:acetyl-CoA acetyltransferase
MSEAWIVDAVRTPMGHAGGRLASVHPDDVAATALAGVVARRGVPAPEVEDVYALVDRVLARRASGR